MKILLSKTGFWRKPTFRVRTDIIQDNKNIFVNKTALGKKSSEILAQTFLFYEKFKTLLPKNVYLSKPLSRKKNVFRFEFNNGQLLEKQIENALLNKDFLLATNLYNEGKDLIMSLPAYKKKIKSQKKFSSFFNIEKKYYENELYFLKIPIVELTADHIFCNKNIKTIIDYEMYLDFSVPREFLLFRYQFHIINQLQQVITTLISRAFPVESYFSLLYIPSDWNYNPCLPSDLKILFLGMESKIHDYLNSERSDLSRFSIVSKDLIFDRLFPKLSKQQIMQISKTEEEKNEITSSKFYKLWRIYCKLRDKFFVKQR